MQHRINIKIDIHQTTWPASIITENIQVIWVKIRNKENLTFVFTAVLFIGFPEEAEVLLQYSSAGGGNTYPERRCVIFVEPVIC